MTSLHDSFNVFDLLKLEHSPEGKDKTCEGSKDRKFASQAVAFVIKHSRKGIVSLCASVAGLLQETEKLKLENKRLEDLLKEQTVDYISKPLQSSTYDRTQSPSIRHVSDTFHLEEPSFFAKTTLNVPSPLQDCLCHQCQICDSSIHYKLICNTTRPLLKVGESVVLKGCLTGQVRYIGHLNGETPGNVFVGVELDYDVGNSKGEHKGTSYFRCKDNRAVFVPLASIRAVD